VSAVERHFESSHESAFREDPRSDSLDETAYIFQEPPYKLGYHEV
jgi:hypothetical protein